MDDIDLFAVIAGLLGGLGLFLLGLRELTDSLKQLAGDRLSVVLRRLTRNRLTSTVTGIGVTAAVQSSSITTVLAVGFVSAGAMSFTQATGVVLGANVGTTVTAQVIAFDLATWALLLVGVGALGLLFGRGRLWPVRANAVLGLGLIFVGMQAMSAAVAPLRDNEQFGELMARFSNPLLGLLAGAFATALLQSSSATTAMVLTLSGQGLVDPSAGVAIIVGANVGSCATAILAALGKSAPARRVAAFHVAVNLLGALAWLGFLDHLLDLAGAITPGEDAGPRVLANAHTVFNVSMLLVMFPVAGLIATGIERLIPDDDPARAGGPSHLDPHLQGTPALALEAARLELLDLAERAGDLVEAALPALLHGGPADLDRLAAADDHIDEVHRATLAYLGALGREPLAEEEAMRVLALARVADALEHIGDIVEIQLVPLGRRRSDLGLRLEPHRAAGLTAMHRHTTAAIRDGAATALGPDPQAAARMPAHRQALTDLTAVSATDMMHRLGDAATVEMHRFEADVIEAWHRLAHQARRLARDGPGSERVDPAPAPDGPP